MRKIGVLFGMENTFPGALVDRINQTAPSGISAELVEMGAARLDAPAPYAVIIDRISHDIPFYRAFLKHAALGGTCIINNPFWSSADDKFFNYALALRCGVAVPPTVLLPHKEHPLGTTDRSLRNLQFPIDWNRVFEYVGFPAFLKPFDGGGCRDVYEVSTPEEFHRAYDQTRNLCMTLQRAVDFREYFRCYVVGRTDVRVMSYDPRRPFYERYLTQPLDADPALIARVERDARTLCQALGYELNTVEFAVEDGVPYAIDFMNPEPDADLHSVGQDNFDWIVSTVAALAVDRATNPWPATECRWDHFLRGGA